MPHGRKTIPQSLKFFMCVVIDSGCSNNHISANLVDQVAKIRLVFNVLNKFSRFIFHFFFICSNKSILTKEHISPYKCALKWVKSWACFCCCYWLQPQIKLYKRFTSSRNSCQKIHQCKYMYFCSIWAACISLYKETWNFNTHMSACNWFRYNETNKPKSLSMYMWGGKKA